MHERIKSTIRNYPGLPIKLMMRDLKAQLAVDNFEGIFKDTVAEGKRRWDASSEEKRETYKLGAKEDEERQGSFGKFGGLRSYVFRGAYPRVPMKVMMKDVEAELGDDIFHSLDYEEE